jgi:hypothetical protein
MAVLLLSNLGLPSGELHEIKLDETIFRKI